jgi:cellulose biosynthesis protein BcsQ
VLARRVAIINEKGGSAKTTLVSTIGAYLALHRGRRVLAIDMDPQGQLGKVLGVETAMVRFNNEWHGTSRTPSNFLRTQLFLREWFQRYSRGRKVTDS